MARSDPGSCVHSAIAAVDPNWVETLDLELQIERVIDRSLAESETPEVRAAWLAWAECMSDSGFDYGTPWAPYLSSWPGDSAGEEEILTAEADVACKEYTGLLEVWSRDLAAAQAALLAENGQPVHRWHQLRQETLARIESGELARIESGEGADAD